ncbi:hypothetical protein pipiens_001418 [Culex pipiens pipiens]|uniref:Uncharacterized protein n=1 Tax=Culex pipiens pipiens TaxID=38569 RepID=A0ABD1CVE6_CULPP
MLKDLIAAETVTPEKCAGCGIPIRDRYYLLVADRAWHNQCLRCCKCLANLETELSCYAREGNIYCKDDYYRNFSSRRCARCGSGINASELVMRAKDLIFHVNCFSCAICGQLLRGGDTAGIREGRLFCGEHYDTDVLSEPETISSQFYPGGGGGTPGRGGAESGDGPAELQPLQPHQQQQQHSQKGRPRKRKPIAQLLDAGQQQGSLQNQPPPQQHDGLDPGTPLRLDLLHKELSVSSLDLSSYDGSQSPGSGGTLTPNCRTKRMRTSFKHHQLRTMKSYFAINQNPDAKDLKQLAQKTGLSKRVLQEGSLMNPGGQPLGSLPSITTVSLHHHHHHFTSAMSGGGGVGVVGNNPSNTSSSDGDLSSNQALEEMHNMTFAELY